MRSDNFAAALFLLALACSEEAPSWESPGDPCNAPSYCTSPKELRECSERSWSSVDCEQHCAAQGKPALGCQNGAVGARCRCGDCPLAPSCLDPQTIEVCSNDTVEAIPCTVRCESMGFSISHGCVSEPLGAQCWCSNGDECQPSEPRCVDSVLLAECEGGVWSLTDCRIGCSDEGGVCTLDVESRHHQCSCR